MNRVYLKEWYDSFVRNNNWFEVSFSRRLLKGGKSLVSHLRCLFSSKTKHPITSTLQWTIYWRFTIHLISIFVFCLRVCNCLLRGLCTVSLLMLLGSAILRNDSKQFDTFLKKSIELTSDKVSTKLFYLRLLWKYQRKSEVLSLATSMYVRIYSLWFLLMLQVKRKKQLFA
jgi:hypothetical protein